LPAIAVENLYYAYPPLVPGQRPTPVLRGVELTVERGELLTIMGPTGVGKSTLCMALNGLVPQATGGTIRGGVTVLGNDTRRTPVAEMAVHVGLVRQDPESQLFATTVQDEVAFGPENLGLDRAEIQERVDWTLDVVGMAHLADRSPAHLSGGQKQRVAIAASLVMLPQVLILDEPTASLDPVGQREVWSLIENLCCDGAMTIVMVSQDSEHVVRYSQRVALLWQGRIARVDRPEAIFTDTDLLHEVGIAPPQMAELAASLNRRHQDRPYRFFTVTEAEAALRPALRQAGGSPEGASAS
jgi:energy-coupling factor transporter ATP-binding protein EcfA2